MMEVPLPRFRLMEKEFPNSDFHELRTEFVKRIKESSFQMVGMRRKFSSGSLALLIILMLKKEEKISKKFTGVLDY